MKKHLRLIISILIFSLILFSCASEGNASGPPSRNPGSDRGREQNMPMPSEAELTVLRLHSLANSTQDKSLLLSREQAAAIIPILEEWLSEISSDPETDPDGFVARISSELTEEQNQFVPQPPSGKPQGGPPKGGKGAQGQRPPGGDRPGEMSIADVLPEVISSLSEI